MNSNYKNHNSFGIHRSASQSAGQGTGLGQTDDGRGPPAGAGPPVSPGRPPLTPIGGGGDSTAGGGPPPGAGGDSNSSSGGNGGGGAGAKGGASGPPQEVQPEDHRLQEVQPEDRRLAQVGAETVPPGVAASAQGEEPEDHRLQEVQPEDHRLAQVGAETVPPGAAASAQRRSRRATACRRTAAWCRWRRKQFLRGWRHQRKGRSRRATRGRCDRRTAAWRGRGWKQFLRGWRHQRKGRSRRASWGRRCRKGRRIRRKPRTPICRTQHRPKRNTAGRCADGRHTDTRKPARTVTTKPNRRRTAAWRGRGRKQLFRRWRRRGPQGEEPAGLLGRAAATTAERPPVVAGMPGRVAATRAAPPSMPAPNNATPFQGASSAGVPRGGVLMGGISVPARGQGMLNPTGNRAGMLSSGGFRGGEPPLPAAEVGSWPAVAGGAGPPTAAIPDTTATTASGCWKRPGHAYVGAGRETRDHWWERRTR